MPTQRDDTTAATQATAPATDPTTGSSDPQPGDPADLDLTLDTLRTSLRDLAASSGDLSNGSRHLLNAQFSALDQTLRAGGRLPAAWTPARPDTVVLDTSTADTLAASVAALDSADRNTILRAFEQQATTEHHATILFGIHAKLAQAPSGRSAVGVLFKARHWEEDGYWLNEVATVLFADGTEDDIDFGYYVREALTAEYHNVGDNRRLAVDLRTGTFESDDMHWATPRERFTIPGSTTSA